ncbi:hypothetical protein Q0F99_10965 [Rathayibacter oskolensis]|uniref:hypothetical protein n=1 Tax=Rathayibacter oskolensis TaxID=1891671 RepID=UPI00265E45D2|nr:hypothetical protein [Rathayibacter oskolensis]WKK70402.1 hypothetical protein Q0F99_10965 [Rathayibacter oskolensis]
MRPAHRAESLHREPNASPLPETDRRRPLGSADPRSRRRGGARPGGAGGRADGRARRPLRDRGRRHPGRGALRADARDRPEGPGGSRHRQETRSRIRRSRRRHRGRRAGAPRSAPLAGRRIDAAPGGSRTYSGSGGNGSFVSTIDPAPYCPGGGSPASAFPKDAFLAVAGGGGGGGDAGDHSSGSTGGSGGAPGSKGGDGGANDARDGAGGTPGTPSGGGAGGAAGYSGFFDSGTAGAPGTYLAGGRAGTAAIVSAYAGGGGGGLYGGGGGGGGTNGGSGGGGGGANYLPPYISPNPPTDQQRSGTLRNGSTDQDGPNVQVVPLYPTVTTVTIAPSPAYVSDELVATVRVTGVDGGPVPVGAVELRTGGDVLTGTLSNGTAEILSASGPPASSACRCAIRAGTPSASGSSRAAPPPPSPSRSRPSCRRRRCSRPLRRLPTPATTSG